MNATNEFIEKIKNNLNISDERVIIRFNKNNFDKLKFIKSSVFLHYFNDKNIENYTTYKAKEL